MSPKRQRARTSPHAFSMEFPQALNVRKDGDAWWLEVDDRELRLSNLNKVFWPDEGYTKGDLIAYYFNVAHLMLPHLSARPLTMKRMPDGIDGPFFYEKSAPSHVPDWIGRCKVLSDDAKTGVIDYMTIEDAAGLLFIANLGCIEFHPLHSRCEDVEHPDYCFFDLDPFPPYTYEDVLTVARHIKALLDQLGLPGFPKTSRRHGPADLRADRTRPVHLRSGARARRTMRPADPAGRPGSSDHGVEDRRPHRQDVHRPQHEPVGARTSRPHTRCAPSCGRRSPPRSPGTRSPRAGSSHRTSASTTSGNGSTRVGDLFAGMLDRGGRPDERVRGAGDRSPRDRTA